MPDASSDEGAFGGPEAEPPGTTPAWGAKKKRTKLCTLETVIFFLFFFFFDSQDLTAPAFPLEKGWGEDSGVRKKGARPRFQRGRAQPPGEQRRGATRAPHNGKEDLGGREGSRQAGCRATTPPRAITRAPQTRPTGSRDGPLPPTWVEVASQASEGADALSFLRRKGRLKEQDHLMRQEGPSWCAQAEHKGTCSGLTPPHPPYDTGR